MTDFEILSIVFVVFYGTWQVHSQTASLYQSSSDNKNQESKNGYPSRKDK